MTGTSAPATSSLWKRLHCTSECASADGTPAAYGCGVRVVVGAAVAVLAAAVPVFCATEVAVRAALVLAGVGGTGVGVRVQLA